MKISPARIAAFNVLLRIETERAYSSILLPIHESGLAANDRSLCHELVLGTLRRQIYLDRLIAHYAKEKKLDAAVRVAIRLGLYQLLFLDRIPEYSSVNDSVNLVQLAGKNSAKGFANAILRQAGRETPHLEFADDVDRLSVETSHPRWLIEKWNSQFGSAETAELAAANNEVSDYAFRSLDGSPVTAASARDSEFVAGCFLLQSLGRDPGGFASENKIYFQDEGSQMVAASITVPAGSSFLDVCAAPGGKTGLIALQNRSHIKLLVAGDLYSPRIEMLKENTRQQRVDDVRIVQYDAEAGLPFADQGFDVVLVDAPCSGTGTIRHNPELRYSIGPADIAALSKKQLVILGNASKLVTRGGSLFYSTCSLEIEENESVCDNFLRHVTGFQILRPKVPDRFIISDSFARTLPHRDSMDGFFIAAFRRV